MGVPLVNDVRVYIVAVIPQLTIVWIVMEEPVITDKEFLTSDILFSFAAIGNCNGLRKYLEDDELDPELKEELLSSRDDQGKTALEIATILGRIEILHVLIEHNCNVNDTTTYGTFVVSCFTDLLLTLIFLN